MLPKRIVAANLTHVGNDFYAFPYENELGFDDYYDEEGRSLRKTFGVRHSTLRAFLRATAVVDSSSSKALEGPFRDGLCRTYGHTDYVNGRRCHHCGEIHIC